MFVGKTCLAGVKVIEAQLEETVQRELASGNKTITANEIRTIYQAKKDKQSSTEATDLVEDKYDSFSWTAVAVAVLLDGITPCAFVTLVFFISAWLILESRKRILS